MSIGPVNAVGPNVGETHVVLFKGDEQYHSIPYMNGFYRSLGINSRAPGIRLPGTIFGTGDMDEEITLQAISPSQMEFYQGIISMGDIADISGTDELESYIYHADRLRKINPLNKVLLFIIGNHEVLHAGSARSGTFLGLLGPILNIQGNRTYKNDIHAPEVGGASHILNKTNLIDRFYSWMFSNDSQNPVKSAPVTIIDSTDQIMLDEPRDPFDGLAGTQPQFRYTLDDKTKGNWEKPLEVYKDFWRTLQDPNGGEIEIANVKLADSKKRYPEQEEFYISSRLLETLEIKSGDKTIERPVYIIGMDSMDYLRSSLSFGALPAHVSALQVWCAKAQIYVKKALNPNAVFILSMHHNFAATANAREIGLGELLSDKSIIGCVIAHEHKRDFVDLNSPEFADKLGIYGRTTPLPQITVPSTTDFPNEAVVMTYGVDPDEPDEIYFNFEFKAIDQDKIPHNSNTVKRVVEELKPYLLTYDDALNHFDDADLKEFATPHTSLGRQAYLSFGIDNGFIFRDGRVHDLMIAHDVIPTMVEQFQCFARLFMGTTEVGLLEISDRNATAKQLQLAGKVAQLKTDYLNVLTHLNSHYEAIALHQFNNENPYDANGIPINPEHNLDHKTIELLGQLAITSHELEEIIEEIKQDESLTQDDKEILSNVGEIAHNLSPLMNSYSEWLDNYEWMIRNNRPDDEIRNLANLTGKPAFRDILIHAQRIPYNSETHAFKTIIALESSKQEVQFYQGTINQRFPNAIVKNVPDQIRFEVEADNDIELETTIPLPLNKSEQEKRTATFGPAPATPLDDNGVVVPMVPHGQYEESIGPQGHWVLKLGTSLIGQSYYPQLNSATKHFQLSASAGRTIHAYDQQGAPHINFSVTGGTTIDWQNNQTNILLPIKATPTIGDRMGLIEVGPSLIFGPSFIQNDKSYDLVPFAGIGGNTKLFEGMLGLEFGKQWYFGPTPYQQWYGSAEIDLLSACRTAGWCFDRSF